MVLNTTFISSLESFSSRMKWNRLTSYDPRNEVDQDKPTNKPTGDAVDQDRAKDSDRDKPTGDAVDQDKLTRDVDKPVNL